MEPVKMFLVKNAQGETLYLRPDGGPEIEAHLAQYGETLVEVHAVNKGTEDEPLWVDV